MEVNKQKLIDSCRADIEHVSNFINKYLPLANLHNTNFITHKYWQQVSPEMRASLCSLPHGYMSGLLLQKDWTTAESGRKDDVSSTWQPDVGPFPQEIVEDTLQPPDPDLPLLWQHDDLERFMQDAVSCHMDRLSYPQLCSQLYESQFVQCRQRSTPFIKHAMGEKKGHEVELMAEVCDQIACESNVNQIVDLGSGKGYLSTTLSMQYGYNVIGIDSQEGNTHGAMQRRNRLEKQYNGLVRREEEKAGLSPAEFKMGRKKAGRERRKQRMEKQLPDDAEKPSNATSYTAVTAFVGPEHKLADFFTESNTQCMLTGLHTCGNLAVSMMKLFLRSDSCRAMLNVGCCYHHISEMFSKNVFKPDEEVVPHFPMSSILIRKKFKLGRNCRMLSMQAMEKSAVQGVGGGLDRALFWRALLQQILLDSHGFWRKNWIVGKISSKCSNFEQYVQKALKKLNMDSLTITQNKIEEYLKEYRDSEHEMAMFFQLRTALSPAIESVILLDRCLFLLEQASTDMVIVKKLFDPVQSPRCYGIIALRKVDSLPP